MLTFDICMHCIYSEREVKITNSISISNSNRITIDTNSNNISIYYPYKIKCHLESCQFPL